jgi:hypothetical protein
MAAEVAARVPPLPYIPVPGVAGFVTVTEIVPGVAMADAGTATISWLPLTKVVLAVWAVPFKFTTALLAKFVPFTVRVNAAPPAVALLGASAATVGIVPATGAVILEL